MKRYSLKWRLRLATQEAAYRLFAWATPYGLPGSGGDPGIENGPGPEG